MGHGMMAPFPNHEHALGFFRTHDPLLYSRGIRNSVPTVVCLSSIIVLVQARYWVIIVSKCTIKLRHGLRDFPISPFPHAATSEPSTDQTDFINRPYPARSKEIEDLFLKTQS